MAGEVARFGLMPRKDRSGVFGADPVNRGKDVSAGRQLAQQFCTVGRDKCGRNVARQRIAQCREFKATVSEV
jgi:hypothetical protein